jgi:UDPglucose 6-dehydrogenase
LSKIAILGSGKVGSATGMGFAQLGHDVLFCDINPNRISELAKQGLNVTDDTAQAILKTDISFVCVPTPAGENLKYVVRVVKEIAEGLKRTKRWHLVVIKSTVIPLTTEKIILPILQASSSNFGLCMNPEFLTEIATTWSKDLQYHRDFWSKERIVIGELNQRSGDTLSEIYKPLKAPIFRMDLRTAEMCKYAANLMLATKISYWNEMGLVCGELGIDSNLVAQITALDNRIGKYGTIHGKAFGGACLPKDLSAFVEFAKVHWNIELLPAVQSVNEFMRENYGVRE